MQTCRAGPEPSRAIFSKQAQPFWVRHPLIQATGSSGTPSPPDGICGLLATGYYFHEDAGDHPRDDGNASSVASPLGASTLGR